ncbi:MAG: DUF3387 domain-containing protein [Candidatus Onthovivens sp.]|nr:DUF3387 domain-containing protein [Candidatus Onthovivens sp.]
MLDGVALNAWNTQEKYKKEKKERIYSSKLDEYKSIIDGKIENNNIPATGIYFLLKAKYDFDGKYGIVNKYVSSKKKEIINNLTIRFETIKGYQSQVDWKINLTLQEKFSTKFNKIVDAYNERTDLADIEKIIEEMINLKKEIEEELEKGNEYNLSSEEKAFFDALGADSEIKELMQDETLVQIAKELVEIINENLTLDAFKREDARARIRVNIRRLLIKYNYPPVKREGAVEQVIRQAELKYQEI